MKLFKSLLVAPATLGLLAPMSVTANELNITDVSGYSSSEEVQNINEFFPKELAVTNSRVDGLEARINNFEAGSFSETTTASFSADMYLGAEDDDDGAAAGDVDDALMSGYSFQIDLNTSFTGEDSLDISLDAGNSDQAGVVMFDGNNTADDVLVVDGVAYTFPFGDSATIIVGDNTDGSALFTTACAYGGPSNTLDDCGNLLSAPTGGGATVGASYDFGNGYTVAAGLQTVETGIVTDESSDIWALNAAYTGDNYGISVSYADTETATINAIVINDIQSLALQAYYTPEAAGFPSFSGGLESSDGELADGTDVDGSHWFLGATWDEVGPGSAGVAIGTSVPTVDIAGVDIDESLMMEAYYSYAVNDGMTITPLIYTIDNTTAETDDTTGVMVKTSFSF